MRKVSVIVPVYNAEHIISSCIESVLYQDYSNFELIIINDGSTDNSLMIISKYAEKDTRIRIISQENSGVSIARNVGIENSTGDYITFLDSDDRYAPGYISRMVAVSEKYNSDLVICGYLTTPEKKEVNIGNHTYESLAGLECEFVSLRESGILNAPWNKLFKRDLICSKFNRNICLGEDLLFVYDYLHGCKKISIISDCLYVYTSPGINNLTQKYHENGFEMEELIFYADSEFADKYLDGKFLRKRLIWFKNGYLRCIHNLCVRSNLSVKEQRRIYKNWIASDLVNQSYSKQLYNGMGIYGLAIKSRMFFPVWLYWKLRNI